MKEKFDRNLPHVNIGEIGKNPNETVEEKKLRINRTKQKIEGILMDSVLKEELNAILDKSLEDLEQQNIQQNEQTKHHR